jgi:hypothetical protein
MDARLTPRRIAFVSLSVSLWLCAGAARAAEPSPEPLAPQRGGEPQVKQTVVEDDHVRVEELRVRGQLQRAVVQPKLPGVKPYEIVTGDAGRDPGDAHRGAMGQRVWNVFGF